MPQQQDSSSFQSVAELGAAAVQASIAFWWRWPALMAGGMPAPDPAETDRQERDRAATAKAVAAQIEAMRNLAEAINREDASGRSRAGSDCASQCKDEVEASP
jgi:hypothetical protein